MPLTADQRRAYPRDWRARRERILERDGYRCRICRVRHLAVGYRDAKGRFFRTGGNEYHDAAGRGELSYAAAQELVREINGWSGGGLNGERYIVIVLTIAHLRRTSGGQTDGPLDCPDEDLAALCQRCHLALDRPRHKAARQARTHAARAAGDLFQSPEGEPA